MSATKIESDSSFVRVLLCDDQAIVGEAIRQVVATLPGAEFRFVQTREALLKELAAFKPTVILQDLVLAECSGITVLKEVRALAEYRDLPIILLSTTDDAKTKFEAFEAGASDYVVKFPQNFELLGRIRYHSRAFINLQEREAAQVLLSHKGRLESLGTLAAGIAHEINTPLQYISANLGYLEESLGKGADREAADGEVASALKDTIEGIQEISSIVRAMKAFAHPHSDEMVSSQVNELIRDVVTLGRSEWKECAKVVCELDPSLAPVQCMPSTFAQALLNLLGNAAHAIREQQKVDGRDGVITIRSVQGRDGIEVTVTDNGCGIASDIQGRIYDPFFTTKPVGEGSGQGLALARSTIVDVHKGRLEFKSTVGQGTQFVVTIPSTTVNNVGEEV